MTLKEIGLLEKLSQQDYNLLDRAQAENYQAKEKFIIKL